MGMSCRDRDCEYARVYVVELSNVEVGGTRETVELGAGLSSDVGWCWIYTTFVDLQPRGSQAVVRTGGQRAGP